MSFHSAQDKDQFTRKFLPLLAALIIIKISFSSLLSYILPYTGLKLPVSLTLMNAFHYNGYDYVLASEGGIFGPGWRRRSKLLEIDGGKLSAVKGIKISGSPLVSLADNRGIWLIFRDHYELYDDNKLIKSDQFMHEILGTGPGAVAGSNNKEIIITIMGYNGMQTYFLEDGELSEAIPSPLPEEHIRNAKQLLIYQDNQFRHYVLVGSSKVYFQTLKDNEISSWQEIDKIDHDYFDFGFTGTELIFLRHAQKVQGSETPEGRQVIADFMKIENFRAFTTNSEEFENGLSEQHVINSGDGKAILYAQALRKGAYQITRVDLTKPDPLIDVLYKDPSEKLKQIALILHGLLDSGFLLIFALLMTKLINKHKTISIKFKKGLEFEFASVFRRELAGTIDFYIIIQPILIVFYTVIRDLKLNPQFYGKFFLLLFLPLIYFVVLEGKYGKTIGKAMVGIRVVTEAGNPCGIPRALLRNLVKIADNFFLLFVIIAYSEKWQRLADMAAKTIVIREPNPNWGGSKSS